LAAEAKTIEELRESSEIAALDREKIQYEEGFTGKAIVGALFIAFIMLPGALYLGLVAGQGLGPAAQWVTIVLFAEVARRSFMPLKKQEIYILFYIAGSLVAMGAADKGLSGGAFGNLIWNQYFIQSPQASAIAHKIPSWVVPPVGSEALIHRTFFHRDWLVPIVLLVVGEILGRMNWIGLGYVLFRTTSDVERLPFPLAPVAAAGATALAEASTKEESWRWQVFSIGTMIGLVFGFFYLALPIFTGVVLSKPLMLIPIPFIDFTRNTENILPAAVTGLSGDLSNILIGFVLPFQMLAGMVTTSILCQVFTNPILYKYKLVPTWRHGMGTIDTQLSTSLDFWMSVGIGVSVAVALIGIATVIRTAIKARESSTSNRRASIYDIPEGRGDFPISLAIAAWLIATVGYIIIGHKLVPKFPLFILIGFGLIYSPLMSYVNARMYGLTSMGVGLPYLREAAILKSGYKGLDIWFAPIPIYDMGWAAQRFREVELTGTKFTSILKAEAFMLPIMLTAGFLFWAFFWHTSPIPSPQFPFAQKFWPLHATMQTIWITSNQSGDSWLLKALKPSLMVYGGIGALGLYGLVSAAKLPLIFFYGAAGGIGALPHSTIPQFAGALLGRYYFSKRFGAENWRKYTPVLLAGFSCGMGLMGMSSIALALISKSVSYLPY
jgi:hypothetical protein